MIQEQKRGQREHRLHIGLLTGAICLLLFEHIAVAVGFLSIYMSTIKYGGGSTAYIVGLLLIGAGIASGVGCLACLILLARSMEGGAS